MRSSGILLHISSLPSNYGIGSLGREAFEFIDFLKSSKQRAWQILPINPVSFGNSPYQSPSVFAGNPLFIDLDVLVDIGLLTKADFNGVFWGDDAENVDFDAVAVGKQQMLKKAFSAFSPDSDFYSFETENAFWLNDYSLFSVLKASHGQKPWNLWECDAKNRNPEFLRKFEKDFDTEIKFVKFCQYIFFRQWSALKKYAEDFGIEIIGDIPIYAAYDSSDVWANRRLYMLGSDGLPQKISGCPPDAFSESGQLWGNPLYRWEEMERDGYNMWLERIKQGLTLFDRLRIDHFRGFESYYAIPYGAKDAKGGVWEKGPGMKLFKTVSERLPGAKIIAEDLGYLTDEVRALLKECGYPGMKVMQFAFDPYNDNPYLLHNHSENCVVYTGTHDNNTTRGWYENENNKDYIRAYLGIRDDKDATSALIRAALSSPAELCIIPIQDYTETGRRMNTPSTVSPDNWSFRIRKSDLNDALSYKISHLTSIYKRA